MQIPKKNFFMEDNKHHMVTLIWMNKGKPDKG